MAHEQEGEIVVEGGQGISNLTVPSISQASFATHIQSLDPVIPSIKDALDAAISASIPALVKSAVKEATTSKSKLKGKKARFSQPSHPPLFSLGCLSSIFSTQEVPKDQALGDSGQTQAFQSP